MDYLWGSYFTRHWQQCISLLLLQLQFLFQKIKMALQCQNLCTDTTFKISVQSVKSLIVLATYNVTYLEINFPNTTDGNLLHLKHLRLVTATEGGTGFNRMSFPTLQSCPEGRKYTHLLLTCKLANEDMYLSSGTRKDEHVCMCVCSHV